MVDTRDVTGTTPEADRQATLREWARKHYLRDHMREDALPAGEFKLLDERLARWTGDRQQEGKLSPGILTLVARLEDPIRSPVEQLSPAYISLSDLFMFSVWSALCL